MGRFAPTTASLAVGVLLLTVTMNSLVLEGATTYSGDYSVFYMGTNGNDVRGPGEFSADPSEDVARIALVFQVRASVDDQITVAMPPYGSPLPWKLWIVEGNATAQVLRGEVPDPALVHFGGRPMLEPTHYDEGEPVSVVIGSMAEYPSRSRFSSDPAFAALWVVEDPDEPTSQRAAFEMWVGDGGIAIGYMPQVLHLAKLRWQPIFTAIHLLCAVIAVIAVVIWFASRAGRTRSVNSELERLSSIAENARAYLGRLRDLHHMAALTLLAMWWPTMAFVERTSSWLYFNERESLSRYLPSIVSIAFVIAAVVWGYSYYIVWREWRRLSRIGEPVVGAT